MKDETDIPTEQAQAEEKIWVPRPHEDGWRAEGDQPPQTRGSQDAGGLDLTLSKELRLRKRSDFRRVAQQGRKVVGRYLCVQVRKGARGLKLGITASGKFGSSPERSRFKRLVREAFRTAKGALPRDVEINVLPRQLAKGASMGQIQVELINLLSSC